MAKVHVDELATELVAVARLQKIAAPRATRSKSGKGSKSATRIVVDNPKTLATHGEEIKRIARKQWDADKSADAISKHLAGLGYGTSTGYQFGTGQVASWLPNREA